MALKIDPWSFPPLAPTPEVDALCAEAGDSLVLAGGCFWCTEAVYRQLDGVRSVRPGYAGGSADTANYKRVCVGDTGHAEVIEITFDPARVGVPDLLKVFFSIAHDPTQVNRQGPDVGRQYRSAIFTLDDDQKAVAERLIEQLRAKGLDLATEVVPAGPFWPAEDYHQDYYNRTGKQPYCHAFTSRF